MQTPTEFKSRDAASYDPLASTFDHHTERCSIYAVPRILALAEIREGKQVIDIGCGTGVVALRAAARTGTRGGVLGVDLSEGMLDVARRRASLDGLASRVAFQKGDAEALDIPDASFDAALSLYVWRHLPNPASATSEAFRVLRSGGCVVIAVGSSPPLVSAAGLHAVINRPFRIIAETMGREITACSHLDGLIDRMLPAAAEEEEAGWTAHHQAFTRSVSSLVADAGFKRVRTEWIGQEHVIEDADAFWEIQTTFSSVARKRLSACTPDAVRDVRRTFNAQCDAVLAKHGRLVYRAGAAIVSATKP